jgi:hypothetical protein
MHRASEMFLVALGAWLVTSLAASYTATYLPVAGLVLGAAGGVVFGLLAARRVDPRKVRYRVGKRRHSHREDDDTA